MHISKKLLGEFGWVYRLAPMWVIENNSKTENYQKDRLGFQMLQFNDKNDATRYMCTTKTENYSYMYYILLLIQAKEQQAIEYSSR